MAHVYEYIGHDQTSSSLFRLSLISLTSISFWWTRLCSFKSRKVLLHISHTLLEGAIAIMKFKRMGRTKDDAMKDVREIEGDLRNKRDNLHIPAYIR